MKYRSLFISLLYGCSAHASIEIGGKFGYQVYNNNYENPNSYNLGFFINVPVTQYFAIETGMTTLGQAIEVNGNKGGFDTFEASLLYSPLKHEQGLFFKLGIAPWIGDMKTTSNYQLYDKGITGLLGAGYSHSIYKNFYGRIEYQFLPDLGGYNIGYTDSHSMSLGLSWKFGSHIGEEKFKAPSQPSSEIKISNSIGTIKYLNKDKRSIEKIYQTSFFFDIDSSSISKREHVNNDRLFKLIKNDLESEKQCKINSMSINAYSDGTGRYKYNMHLSEKRAQSVSSWVTKQLNTNEKASIAWHGAKLFKQFDYSQKNTISERRVDLEMKITCNKWEY